MTTERYASQANFVAVVLHHTIIMDSSLCRSPFCLFLLLVLSSFVFGATKSDCENWAEQGECENNPAYMLRNCQAECDAATEADVALQTEFENVSFFDLSARDIDGTNIDFSTLQGKVTIVTNVASYCGYTESHYRGLVELWSSISSSTSSEMVTILAFPCNQFGRQEPGTNTEIKQFARKKGVEFTMMDKVDVNGANAHKVFQFLKYKTQTKGITWNFATYFVVAPDGTTVTAHEGVEPMDLMEDVFELLGKDEL